MKQTTHEDLSRMMDGDLRGDLCRFLARRIAREPSLRQRWDRYHLVRCYLHDGETRPIGEQFLRGIRDRIADVNPDPAPRRVLKPLVGAAVAASVAVLGLVGVNRALLDRAEPGHGSPVVAEQRHPQPAFAPRATPLDRQFRASAVPVNLSTADHVRTARFNDYLARHNQMVGQGGRMGFVSYLPIVVTDQPVARWPQEASDEDPREPAEARAGADQGKR